MNTAIATHTGTYSGLGFAIPIDMIRDSVDQIIEHGKVVRGYLGIVIRPLTPAMAESFGFRGEGVLVENSIKGGPAEAAGVQRGDIISKINDRTTTTADDLRGYVASLAPGRKADLTVFRDGKTMTLTATIGEMPAQVAGLTQGRGGSGAIPEEKSRAVLRKLGLDSVVTMSDEVAQRFHITNQQPGVLVLAVRPNSAAADSHITRGCILSDVNGVKVESVDQLVSELGKHDLTKGVRLTVVEEGTERFEMLQLPEK
jgi:serine protease Do